MIIINIYIIVKILCRKHSILFQGFNFYSIIHTRKQNITVNDRKL